ncbi:hypothetical protein EIKCOROL_00476 [Eikenella corrodens ATCC 23834]|uniref:Uncharacterized protein n=1 Tax=Eikenella corrodens ATCC 23834 TaxID=546274 RepID=C0DT02_EIKCO|nr:hypothetical protein EIKCOROL_00476 [Eikenella corrodens ATCC 23834]
MELRFCFQVAFGKRLLEKLKALFLLVQVSYFRRLIDNFSTMIYDVTKFR